MERRPLRIGLTVVAGMLACGLPLWPILSTPGNPMPVWLALGSLAGVLGGYLLRPGFATAVWAVVGGFVLVILARVGWETGADPTSHNLWPFEVVMAAFFGLISAATGVGLARGIQRITARRLP